MDWWSGDMIVKIAALLKFSLPTKVEISHKRWLPLWRASIKASHVDSLKVS
jgi:hypothetical protein